MLGVILELFVVKEDLLTGSEDKVSPTIHALQDPIGKFHMLLPRNRETNQERPTDERLPFRVPCSVTGTHQGPGAA